MSKKFNNKILLALLALLVIVFFVTNYMRDKGRSDHSIRTELVSIDSAAVVALSVFPQSAGGQEIRFSKKTGRWQVESNGITAEPAQGTVGRLIGELQRVKPQRVAAQSKELWEKYSLTDSLATRVTIFESGDNKTLDILIGKFSYQQPPGGFNQMGGGQNITGTTYVRLEGEEEIYATEGFLAMSFNRDFNSWRNAGFLKAEKPAISKLHFEYAGDSSFTLLMVDSVWLADEEKADSIAIDGYLNTFVNRQERNFADGFIPAGASDHTITVGGNMNDLVVSCYLDTAQSACYLHSSINPGVYFRSDLGGLYKQLFVGRDSFVPSEK